MKTLLRLRSLLACVVGCLALPALIPAVDASLSGRKIGLDPGHGEGKNMGVVVAEGTWVLDAAFRTRNHLENHGATVVMTRTTGADPALSTRVNILNSNNVNLAVSLHSNAASAAAQGLETYYCAQHRDSASSRALADRLRLRTLSMVHNQNRGIGTKECLDAGRNIHFTMVRSPTMPVSLPELYFHTNDWENRNIHNLPSGRENVARSLYAGICDQLGVTPQYSDTPPPEAAFAAGDWVRTTANPTLNLRAGPGTTYSIIKELPFHTVAQVRPHADNGLQANNNTWWYVEVFEDGSKGWLAEFYLEKTSSPSPFADVVVDNTDPGFAASGNWTLSTSGTDKHGADFRQRPTAAASDPARWSANLPGTGTYDVYAWWPAGSNRATASPYIVSHANGSTTVPKNQTTDGGKWNLLGRFTFTHDSTDQVALSCWTSTTSNVVVVADAVRFAPIDVEAPNYTLTVSTAGNGAVSRSPDASTYQSGTPVELTPQPAPGFRFVEWSGDGSGSEVPLIIKMDGSKTVTATFVAETYTIDTEVAGEGTVTRDPDAESYSYGQTVQVMATPAAGFEFTGWDGDVQSSESTLALTVQNSVNLSASFARSYNAWAAQHFTPAEREDESVGGDKANPSGDGLPNLLKYALGLNPLESTRQELPRPEVTSLAADDSQRFLTLTFSHPSNIEDVEYKVQVSKDLADWGTAAELVEETDDPDGRTTRVYRDPVPYDSAAGGRFMRLHISR